MVSTILEIFDLLTTTPGNLAFHLIIAFTIGGSLLSAISQMRKSDYPQSRRLVTTLALLLAIRVLYFFIAGAFWGSAVDRPFILATIDRTVTIISTLLILWVWVYPEPYQNTDFFSAMLVLLTIIFAAFSVMQWGTWAGDESFNSHWLDIVWGTMAIALILVGEILLIRRRPNLWEYGFTLAAILFVGHLIHLIFPLTESDFQGAVRLSQLVAFPLIFILPGRFAVPARIESPVKEDRKPFEDRRQFSTDLKTFEAFLALASETDPAFIHKNITKSISHALMADICILLTAPDEDGGMIIQCGYDLIREKVFEGTTVSDRQLPDVADALRKNRQIQLPDSSTSQDLAGIEHYLGISHAGSTLVYPLKSQSGESLGGLVLLSPYTHRVWSDQAQEYLAVIGYTIARILERDPEGIPIGVDIEQLHERIETQQSEIERVLGENNEILLNMKVLQDKKDELTTQLETAADSYETLMRVNEEIIEELDLTKGSTSNISIDDLQNLVDELEEVRFQNESIKVDLEKQIREKEELSALVQVFGKGQEDRALAEIPVSESMEGTPFDGEDPEMSVDAFASTLEEWEGVPGGELPPSDLIHELEVRNEEAQKVIAHLVGEIDSLQERLESSIFGSDTSELPVPDEAVRIELRSAMEEIQILRQVLEEQTASMEETGIPQPMEADTQFDPQAINEFSLQMNQSINHVEQQLSKVLSSTDVTIRSPQRLSLMQAQIATDQIKSILNDLTFISMFERGDIDLSLTELDVSKIIDNTIDEVGAEFRRKNIALHFNVQEDIPRFVSDAQTLQQIIKYLLINACKVTPVEGEVSLKVVQFNEMSLQIEVTDSGGGIFPDDIPLVFNRLYDLGSPPVPGIADKGIGLSLSKSMVEALNGTIEVDSVIGDGSTFLVNLPMDVESSGRKSF